MALQASSQLLPTGTSVLRTCIHAGAWQFARAISSAHRREPRTEEAALETLPLDHRLSGRHHECGPSCPRWRQSLRSCPDAARTGLEGFRSRAAVQHATPKAQKTIRKFRHFDMSFVWPPCRHPSMMSLYMPLCRTNAGFSTPTRLLELHCRDDCLYQSDMCHGKPWQQARIVPCFTAVWTNSLSLKSPVVSTVFPHQLCFSAVSASPRLGGNLRLVRSF